MQVVKSNMKLKATKNFNKGTMWEEITMKLKAQ